LLLQIKITIINTFFICIPIVVLIISIYLKNKKIGIIGLFLFYSLSLSPIFISSVEEYFQIFLELFFVILPSLFLLSQILQIGNKQWFIFQPEKKPIILVLSLFIVILIIFYLVIILLWDGFLLSTDNIEAQILILIAISCSCCLPLILVQKIKNKDM